MPSDPIQLPSEHPSGPPSTLSMTTLSFTTTLRTQETTTITSGPAQFPQYTIYSLLPPIEMASYPDPIMSATGADLRALLDGKAAGLSTGLMSNGVPTGIRSHSAVTATATHGLGSTASTEGDALTGSDGVVLVTFTTEYGTTSFITMSPREPSGYDDSSESTVVPTSIEHPNSSDKMILPQRQGSQHVNDIIYPTITQQTPLLHDTVVPTLCGPSTVHAHRTLTALHPLYPLITLALIVPIVITTLILLLRRSVRPLSRELRPTNSTDC